MPTPASITRTTIPTAVLPVNTSGKGQDELDGLESESLLLSLGRGLMGRLRLSMLQQVLAGPATLVFLKRELW